MRRSNRSARRFADALLGILMLLGSVEFVVRGPARFASANSFNDFISPYSQSREWLRGQDPYSPENLVRSWPSEAERFAFLPRDLAEGALVLKRGIPTAYPPTTFALLAPVVALPWGIAHHLWLAITVLSFVTTVACLLSVAGLLPCTRRGFVFLALALAWAPFHTGLAAGSIVCVAVGAATAAVWAAARRYEILAGTMIAIAFGLKPQIGLPFFLFYLLRRSWRLAASAAAALFLVASVALIRCHASGTWWLQNYLYDNRVLFGPGSLGDFTDSNPLRFGLIHAQVAAYALFHSRPAANAAAFVIAAVAGLLWLFLLRKNRAIDLLALSALATLSILPVYHRFYDASLPLFPLAWGVAAFHGPLRTTAGAVLLTLMLVFLFPGGTALMQMQKSATSPRLRGLGGGNLS